jgi:transcriptional regulator with XRE-family HTH domain
MGIREVRESRRMTQERLAELSGVTQSAISAIELGTVKVPGVDTAGKIARALGVTVEELFPVPEPASQEKAS